jgi:hypothetical protein
MFGKKGMRGGVRPTHVFFPGFSPQWLNNYKNLQGGKR